MSLGTSALVEVLSPSAVLGGGLMAAIPWLRRDHAWARALLVSLAIALMWRYMVWRLTATLPPPEFSFNFAAGIIFAVVETLTVIGASLSLFFLARVRNRSPEVEANTAWFKAQPSPRVAVCICTYNEEEAILERTIMGALALRYGNLEIWVLDDGRREWLRSLCAQREVHYLTRPDNSHAKAGNINNALAHFAKLAQQPDFVVILDADFVPMGNFLARTLPLFRAPDVGLVQTPQHFVNPDPIQANLSVASVWPDEQRYFFDVVMPSKDAWGMAFCCGTSAVIRYRALAKVGGFPTDSVTEDYLVTLRMQQADYRTVYLNEKLSLGLAPEGLREYVTQRARWCLGFMQICRGPLGPFRPGNGLSALQRLSLIESLLYWSASYAYRALCIVIPAAYWLFGISVVQANVGEAVSYFVPYFLSQIITMTWLAGGRTLPILAEVSQLIVVPEILRAVWAGLTRPKGQKFSVTAKGGVRDKRVYQWRLLFRFTVLLGLTIGGVLLGWFLNDGRALDDAGGLCLFWSWYNIVMLTIACVVCVEQPRYRKDERFVTTEAVTISVGGQLRDCTMLDCSLGGMRFAGTAPAPYGSEVTVRLGSATVMGTIARATDNDFALRLQGDGARAAMIRQIYSGRALSPPVNVRTWHVLATIAQRLFR